MIEAHDVPYLVFDVVVAGAFWAALVLLLLTSARHNHWLRKAGLIVITAMAGAFWTAAAVLRVYDHGLPAAVILNWWSRVLYAMLAFYVLGYAWLNWRMRRE